MTQPKLLSSLHIYPIKSCGAISLQEVSIGRMGPAFDRRWMVVDTTGRFLSLRNTPRMIFIETALENGDLVIRIPQHPVYRIALEEAGKGIVREVSVWKDTCLSVDQGDTIATALSQFLDVECRLVFMPDTTHRYVNPEYAVTAQDTVGFADAYPALLIAEASLDELNSRLEQPVSMNRFRPNFVVGGCQPFEEDRWKAIRIGPVHFQVVKLCSRCIAITVDATTGEKGLEPMQTLTQYRMQDKKIMFGVNLVQTSHGDIRVGDCVEVLEKA